MQLLRQEIVEMLQENGDIGTAQLVKAKFPKEIDTEKDRDLLRQEGVDIEYLLSRRTGSER